MRYNTYHQSEAPVVGGASRMQKGQPEALHKIRGLPRQLQGTPGGGADQFRKCSNDDLEDGGEEYC